MKCKETFYGTRPADNTPASDERVGQMLLTSKTQRLTLHCSICKLFLEVGGAVLRMMAMTYNPLNHVSSDFLSSSNFLSHPMA